MSLLKLILWRRKRRMRRTEPLPSCDKVRRDITMFLATKEMAQIKFLDTISVNANSFGRFMKLKGSTSGRQNGTYWGAVRFFEHRKGKKKSSSKRSRSSKTPRAQLHLLPSDKILLLLKLQM
jgi:hypothetical protein